MTMIQWGVLMKELDIREFRANCSAWVNRVQETKKPVRIRRDGKPVAEVVPYFPLPKWIGSMKGKMEILGDIVSPASEPDEWEVLKDRATGSLFPLRRLDGGAFSVRTRACGRTCCYSCFRLADWSRVTHG
jgi:prevent-host-death family protein